jgi:hypothetical protein
MKRIFALSTVVTLSFGAVMADGLKGTGKYGAAGCGLGSMVFADQKGPIQILAATTNDAIFPQTSAISSGTSNCFEDGVALKDKEQEFFANTNFESLHQEMAQGQGENLKAFAYLFGCQGTDVQAFSEAVHLQFGFIFPSDKTNSLEMLGNVRSMVKSNPKLQLSCSERA